MIPLDNWYLYEYCIRLIARFQERAPDAVKALQTESYTLCYFSNTYNVSKPSSNELRTQVNDSRGNQDADAARLQNDYIQAAGMHIAETIRRLIECISFRLRILHCLVIDPSLLGKINIIRNRKLCRKPPNIHRDNLLSR